MRAVVSFHAIDEGQGPLSFSPAQFDRLLAAFASAKIPVLTLDRLLAPDAPAGIALTFDDGLRSVHDVALPIMRNYGVPAHVFLTTASVNGDNQWAGQPVEAARYESLTWKQLETLHLYDVAIESHTANHPDLRRLAPAAIIEEMAIADGEIERRVGKRPSYFAYPYGFHNAEVRRLAGGRYKACFTTELRYLTGTPRQDAMPRLDSHYLRSPLLVRNLDNAGGCAFIALRRAIRVARGRS